MAYSLTEAAIENYGRLRLTALITSRWQEHVELRFHRPLLAMSETPEDEVHRIIHHLFAHVSNLKTQTFLVLLTEAKI